MNWQEIRLRLPWQKKDKRSYGEKLLEARLGDTDRVLKRYATIIDAIFNPNEKRLYRAAFTFATLPDIQFQFSSDQENPKLTPSEQLERIKEALRKPERLDPQNPGVINYLSSIVNAGTTSSLMHATEQPERLVDYLKNFSGEFKKIKQTINK